MLLKKIYKSWSNASFNTIVNKSSKKVICCNLIPSDDFYNDNININPFKDNGVNEFVEINTIEESINEQSSINNAIFAMEQRRMKRKEDREKERLEDKRELILFKKRENELDIYLEKSILQNIICKNCKLKQCICNKITTFFR